MGPDWIEFERAVPYDLRLKWRVGLRCQEWPAAAAAGAAGAAAAAAAAKRGVRYELRLEWRMRMEGRRGSCGPEILSAPCWRWPAAVACDVSTIRIAPLYPAPPERSPWCTLPPPRCSTAASRALQWSSPRVRACIGAGGGGGGGGGGPPRGAGGGGVHECRAAPPPPPTPAPPPPPPPPPPRPRPPARGGRAARAARPARARARVGEGHHRCPLAPSAQPLAVSRLLRQGQPRPGRHAPPVWGYNASPSHLPLLVVLPRLPVGLIECRPLLLPP